MKLKLYVDGSWMTKNPERSGWAFVIVDDADNIILEKSGSIKALSRQVDGELHATIKGLEALEILKGTYKSPSPQVSIHYDYIGIQKWALGEWKAKSPVAIKYVKKLGGINPTLLKDLQWVKIKSHNKEDPWNDYVDLLAKKELG